MMYESFLDFFSKKTSPTIKLAESLVNFINSIDYNLKCYYEKNGRFISINNNFNNLRLLTIDSYKMRTMNLQFIKINVYHANLNENENLVDFIYEIFDVDINLNYIYFDITEKDIPNCIEKLTKENYDNFLIKKSSDKFNI